MAVTIEQLEEALDVSYPYEEGVDRDVAAITLLRHRIPYEECRGIIGGAEHDKIVLCDIDKALPYLLEEDLPILSKAGVFIDEGEYFAMFV